MKVLHVLSCLKRSGAERMLECSHELWHAAGVEPIIVGMADGDHPYASALRGSGYPVIELPAVRSIRGLAALRRSVRAVRPDIVHIHQESCLDAVALVAKSSRTVKGVVQTVHSSFPFNGNLRARRTARAAFSRRLGVTWVACAEQVAENERSRFRNPTLVVENWVDVDGLAAGATMEAGLLMRQGLGVEPRLPVVGLIGNCDEPKNHELIPRALMDFREPVHILHIGDRSAMPPAESASWPQLPERHTVHDLGSRDDIPELLAACDVVLVPSRREGLPLVALEALCAGVPVLAADVPALQWLSSFPAASLVSLEPGAWGAAIGAMLNRDWDLEVKQSSAAARSRFSPSRGVSEYSAVYDRVLGRPRSPLSPEANHVGASVAHPD